MGIVQGNQLNVFFLIKKPRVKLGCPFNGMSLLKNPTKIYLSLFKTLYSS